MINWPDLQLPPINLYNAPEINRMHIQPASEHNIIVGMGHIQGCVTEAGNPCWSLPGGRITDSREEAEKAARYINRKHEK